MRKINEVQIRLLKMINDKKADSGIFEYDDIKKRCSEFKSFDGTFEALFSRGHIKRFITKEDKNTFKTAI